MYVCGLLKVASVRASMFPTIRIPRGYSGTYTGYDGVLDTCGMYAWHTHTHTHTRVVVSQPAFVTANREKEKGKKQLAKNSWQKSKKAKKAKKEGKTKKEKKKKKKEKMKK